MKKKTQRVKKKMSPKPVRIGPAKYPDFAALQKRIFGKKKSKITGTELVSEQRGPY